MYFLLVWLVLVIFLCVAFNWIPQFIAKFCSICPLVCPPLSLRQNFVNLRDSAEAVAAYLCPCCHYSLLSPSEGTQWRGKKVIKIRIVNENGKFEGFSLKSKVFLCRNNTFLIYKTFFYVKVWQMFSNSLFDEILSLW